MPRVLVVDDDPSMRRMLGALLRRMGCDVVDADDGIDAIGKLRAAHFDLVITDLRMPRADGFAVLAAVREQQVPTPAIMLAGEGSVADCVTAMKAGATNFLNKPFNGGEFEKVVRDALAEARHSDDGKPKRSDAAAGRPQVALIGGSARLRAFLAMVQQVADTDATVLLTGETGTGKEVVSRLLHGVSRRAVHPFVPVNCGAIPEGLVESELFGHAKGAFTGATDKHAGRFVQADGGTLFLDEVGELPLPVQVKLLRVIEDREVTPVGESRSRAVDIRLIAATHRDLQAMSKEGTFREDLYYRLNVVAIEIPPLRERTEDIPALAGYFLDVAARRAGKTLSFADSALAALLAYRWPGNVRELENLVERLTILNRSGTIRTSDLPANITGTTSPARASRSDVPDGEVDLTRTLERVEDGLIEAALRKSGGNRSEAAKHLGLNRTTLVEKLRRKARHGERQKNAVPRS